jgi:glycosyl hydrolase family 113
MMALIALGLLFSIVLLSCSSCSTSRTEQVTEHVTGPLNLTMEMPYGSAGDFQTDEFHRGVSLVSRSAEILARPESDETIRTMPEVGATAMSLVVTWYQEAPQSEKIEPHPTQSIKDEALVHAINQAHRAEMKVMLKPHIDCLDGTFRGEIVASTAWFASYKAFILHYARLAEMYHVELLCFGTELENISFDQWKPEWTALITEIRKAYNGKITYAANWTEYPTVAFWDQVDFVGIDAYFPVTKKLDPTQDELDDGWKQIAGKISAWRSERGITKAVLFTEIGYQSADGANVTPWQTTSRKEDQNEQAMVLEGMFRAMEPMDWFQGVYWWNYYPREVWRPLDFTIKGKKAEQVLKKWYEKERSS